MIALNETNEYAAEVAFNLPLASDPLTGLTGHSFTLGEVQIKLPGQSWQNATLAKIVEKGYGRFAVRLTSTQTTTAGDVFVRAVVSGTQTYFGGDVIGELGGDIPVGGTGSVAFFLPDAIDPYSNPPLTGTPASVFSPGDVRVCLPDAAYVDADIAQIEEIGFGGYKLNLTALQTAKKGKVFIYASVSGYQPFEGYGTILGVGASSGSGTGGGSEPEPVPLPVQPGTALYVDHAAAAISRLCEYAKAKAA